jgi:hypothetical protein
LLLVNKLRIDIYPHLWITLIKINASFTLSLFHVKRLWQRVRYRGSSPWRSRIADAKQTCRNPPEALFDRTVSCRTLLVGQAASPVLDGLRRRRDRALRRPECPGSPPSTPTRHMGDARPIAATAIPRSSTGNASTTRMESRIVGGGGADATKTRLGLPQFVA